MNSIFLFFSEPPSPVRNVRIKSRTPDSVTLVWDPPVNFGGRNDTVYVLFQEEGNTRRVEAGTVNTTMGTIISTSSACAAL